MDEQEMFDHVCKDRFDKIDQDNGAILKILKGDESSDTPKLGLCERVRTLEKIKNVFMWACGLIISGWILANSVAFVEWIGRVLIKKTTP